MSKEKTAEFLAQIPDQPQAQAQADQARDLEQERQVYERMLERQSEASRQYSMGKFRSA